MRRLPPGSLLVRAVVRKLQIHAQILASQQAMMACSSSRSLLDILTVSPWMLACAFFFESLTRRTISLAFSMGMPCCRMIFWRTLWPAAGSTLP